MRLLLAVIFTSQQQKAHTTKANIVLNMQWTPHC